MTPFKCYKLYLALKRHFTTDDYDFFKYRGKVRANEQSFKNRKDNYLFVKMALRQDVLHLLVSTLANHPNFYVTDILSERGDKICKGWKKYQQSYEYSFKEEIKQYENFDKAIIVKEGYPEIISDYISGKVSLDTISAVDKIIDGCAYWSSHLKDPLWDDINRQLMKYRPFVNINTDTYKRYIYEIYGGQNEIQKENNA